MPVSDELYQSIVACDTRFDGKVFIAIQSTGIVCFPSCRSRTPKRENIRVFATLDEAVQAGFRPCKRCKPDNLNRQSPDAELAQRVLDCLRRRFAEPITLQSLASQLNISPHHLQRTFTRVVGTSPAKQLQRIRLDRAKHLLLADDQPVAEIASAVGFRSVSHFGAAFRAASGFTPIQFRIRQGVES